MKFRTICAAVALLGLAACHDDNDTGAERGAEPGAGAKYDAGLVAKVATAPDGTVLWEVNADGQDVYFASSGTQRRVQHGKTSSIFWVPTARGDR